MIVFTSITLNYLPKAKILAKSIKKFHPDWQFHLLISDRVPADKTGVYQQELTSDIFDLVCWSDNLPIENIRGWFFKHTVVELCTAVKGIYLKKLADEGHKKIMYIDPDIAVFNPLSPLDSILDNAGIILAPHLLDYTDNTQSIQDNEIAGTMRHGTFNLGFLAVNTAQPDGRRFVDWWAARLRDYCYADYDRGLFTDQKWCDLAPSFFPNLHILRDPGYDVASWNLDCREISFDAKGQLLINQTFPLRFYHFTGYDSGAGANVVDYLTTGGANPIARELWGYYVRQLEENGQARLGQQACYFDTFDHGVKIEVEMRKAYRNSEHLQQLFSDPYDTDDGKGGFLAWWKNETSRKSPDLKTRKPATIIESNQATSHPQVSPIENAQLSVYQELLAHEKHEQDEAYVPLLTESFRAEDALIKLIAFYLPQYHPIPENDAWWGRGFTEWANVSRAVPQFSGHYQPHVPGELGYYDLRVEDVHRRQIDLAKQYGLHGFAYYHYWFAGRRLLEMPVNRFLKNKNMDFPFCLIWANENWTRRWDGMESDVLIAQEHSPESDDAFIKDLEPYLRDERYIRIQGRPVIIVYRTDILPEPAATAERWREYCVTRGLGEPYLIAAQTFGFSDPRTVGFDAAMQFPPHNQWHDPDFMIQDKTQLANPAYSSYIFSYPKMVQYQETHAEDVSYPLFKTVFPSWDSEPRKPGRGTIYTGSKPELYRRWLRAACQWTLRNHDKDSRFVFVNAWNEWAEGAHLEPDRRFGYAYLEATKNELRKLSS